MKSNISKTELKKKQLAEAIEYTNKLKSALIEYNKNLDKLYKSNQLSDKEYLATKNKVLQQRTLKQWTTYYDDCIKYYQNELKNLQPSIPKNTILTLLILLFSISLITFSAYTGYTSVDSIGTLDDSATILDYPSCPSTDGIFTLSSSLVWGNSTMVCSNITINSGGILKLNSTAAGNTSINVTADTITINSGGIISSSGFGFLSKQGPGLTTSTAIGASYASFGAGASKSPYGSIEYPLTLGSGGSSTARTGVAGGGAMFLNASGTLTNNGVISSNATYTAATSGGSGGSIYIIASTFSGSGTIESIGGTASAAVGGGSGGRVAIYSTTNTFTGIINASGGQGTTAAGGPGTIFLKSSAKSNGSLIFDNANRTSSARSELNSTFLVLTTLDELNITNNANVYLTTSLDISNNIFELNSGCGFFQQGNFNASNLSIVTLAGTMELMSNYTFNKSAVWTLNSAGNLSHRNNSATQLYFLNITAKNFTINSGAMINATNKGYAFLNGPGRSLAAAPSTHGAGYGGMGGTSSTAGGLEYGSITAPLDLGSGGGIGKTDGGGAIFLNITDTLINNGIITSSSLHVTGGYGTGSGGSIYLVAGNFSGNGEIDAHGGLASTNDAGAGGRIAVYSPNYLYTGSINASGGYATDESGGAGTIFLKVNSDLNGQLLIKNGNFSNMATTHVNSTFISLTNLDNLTIENGAYFIQEVPFNVSSTIIDLNTPSIWLQNASLQFPNLQTVTIDGNLILSNDYTFNPTANWTLNSGGDLTHDQNNIVQLNIINLSASTFTINSGAKIDTTKKGYRTLSGPAPGTSTAKGASHGGLGGNTTSAMANGVYDSLTRPLEIGSGGGVAKTDGGGAIFLNVSGTLTNNGIIASNATLIGSNSGGSGGSVYLIVNTLTGNGVIEAEGGSVTSNAAGGGGRIALYYQTSTFTGSINVSGGASPGGSSKSGSIGSLFICQSPSGTNCAGLGNLSVVVTNGAIILNTDYSLNASINVNKTVNVSFTQNSVNWTDQTNNNLLQGTINATGLAVSSSYDVYNNLVLDSNRLTDAAGKLASFVINIVDNQEVSIQNSSIVSTPSVVGITLDDNTIAFGSGYYNASCTDNYALMNSNISNNCWINTTAFPNNDVHLITNNGTVNVNVTAYALVTDAEETFCGSSQGCTLTALARIAIISQNNETGSCTGLDDYGILATHNSNSTRAVCNSLSSSDSTDQVRTFIELYFPKDSTAGAKSITIVYEAITA